MKNRLPLLALLVALLALGAAWAYYWGTPQLLAVSPEDGAAAVPAGTEIRMTFSRPMQAASIAERLIIDPARKGTFSEQGDVLVFTPEEPWEAGTNVNVQLQPGALTAGWLPIPLLQSITWSFHIRQPELAYLYPANSPANIYGLNPLSGESKLLTSHPSGVVDFSVSANGAMIYYSANNAQGGSDIYRLDLVKVTDEKQEGLPEPILVLPCPQAKCRAPALSPRGDILAYERAALPGSGQADYPQVWYLPLPAQAASEGATAPVAPLTPILAGEVNHQTLQPSWSPEGLLTFYDTTAAAFAFLDIPSVQRTFFPNQTGLPGSWNPNGRDFIAAEILFMDTNIAENLEGLREFANSHLILFNRLDSQTVDLTPAVDMEDTSPSFSPNGRFLAFARKYLDANRWTPGRQVWLLHMGSRDAQPMTDEPNYNHFDFAWSPASDQLAYVRFDQTSLTEPPEIWLMDPLTGRAILLIAGGYSPRWIP